MAAAEVVRARINSDLKFKASAVLSSMGLSVSDAIRLMLVRVVSEGTLPFDVRVPNAATQAAIRDARNGKVTRTKDVASLMAALNTDDDDEDGSVEHLPLTGRTVPAGAFRDRTIEITGSMEEAVVGKEVRVEEIIVGRTADNPIEAVSDTVRRTAIEVDDVRYETSGLQTGTSQRSRSRSS